MGRRIVISSEGKVSKAVNLSFQKDAPMIKELAKNLKTPLTQIENNNIYSGIFRNQISMDNLRLDVQSEFMISKHYKQLILMGLIIF